MIIWLHEKLYNYVKDDPVYREIERKTQESWGAGDLATYHSLFTQKKRRIYTESRVAYYDYFANLDMPEDLKIRWQISTITDWFNRDNHRRDNEDYPIGVWMNEQISNPKSQTNALSVFVSTAAENVEDFIVEMAGRIDALPDGADKISCKIYLLQHKLNYLNEDKGYSHFHPEVAALRRELVSLFDSNSSYEYEEEVLVTVYFNKSDLFFIDNGGEVMAKRSREEIQSLYEKMCEYLAPYEDIALTQHPTDYMRNNINHSKLHIHRNFFNHYVQCYFEGGNTFKELDEWFNEKITSIEFKYKDFNYSKIRYMWERFTAYMSHGYFYRGIELLQDIYDVIAEKMQDKNRMGKQLNYRADSYHTGFFAYIASLRKLETELLNDFYLYKNKDQFNSLVFNPNEELLLREDWCGNSNSPWALNYSWLRSKLLG